MERRIVVLLLLAECRLYWKLVFLICIIHVRTKITQIFGPKLLPLVSTSIELLPIGGEMALWVFGVTVFVSDGFIKFCVFPLLLLSLHFTTHFVIKNFVG